jgi:hypothetical protein
MIELVYSLDQLNSHLYIIASLVPQNRKKNQVVLHVESYIHVGLPEYNVVGIGVKMI